MLKFIVNGVEVPLYRVGGSFGFAFTHAEGFKRHLYVWDDDGRREIVEGMPEWEALSPEAREWLTGK